MLEVKVELESSALEDMVSAGVERGAEQQDEGPGLICEPESGRV